jgi:plasmid segregation protein ParM
MTEPDRLPKQASQVLTRSLPEGELFVAGDGVIYQVVLAGSAGFRKAKRWGGSDQEAVALVPDSPLAYHYPVVEHGTPLPRPKRAELTGEDDETVHFSFPNEKLARAAANLDEALAWHAGCMARKEDDRWILTDGMHEFRVYHYEWSDDNLAFDLETRFEIENVDALPHSEGPAYWSYLPKAIESEEASSGTEKPAATPKLSRSAPTEDALVETAPMITGNGGGTLLSVDIGYGYTKAIGTDDIRFSFPSIIGNAEEIAFTDDLIAPQAGPTVHYGGRRFFYGEQALLQSRLQTTIFDRSRVHDDTYRFLFAAALAESARHLPDGSRLNVVTGLPVGFFSDRDDVVFSLGGEYELELDEIVTFYVEKVFVVPQPFGSLFRELLNEDGVLSNMNVEQGRVAVIDVGTFTVDFIVADALRYVQRLSSSISTGWSEVLGEIQRELSDRHRLDLTLHEVKELETMVVAKARDLWGEGATLDAILVTGGAAEHLVSAIQAVYPQAKLVPSAFWANAEGFYRFGQRPATFGEG